MKNSMQRRWLLSLLAGATLFVSAWLGATPAPANDMPPQTPESMGGGEFVIAHADALSAEAEAAILSEISRNQQRLYQQDRLALPLAGATVALAWPMRPAAGFTDYGYYAVTNFMDHDPAFPDLLRDYNNGTRSYDTTGGYNHSGTDYVLWPFAWLKMANNAVEVIAAADGVIVGKSDGHPDQSCSYSSSPWNAVYVQHADGTVAWYGHLKTNSLTTKAIGAAVVSGEYLGLVGSSGSSTTPHLHFEVRNGGGQESEPVDPYVGPGNPTLAESRWGSQPAYYDPAIVHLGAGAAEPSVPDCPQQEQPNEQELFDRGDTVYLSAYYRDQRQGQVSDYRVLRPDGTQHATWSHSGPAPHYAVSYWWWTITLPADAPAGEWRFQVAYEGKTYEHSFFAVTKPVDTATPTIPAATPTVTSTPTRAPGVVPRAYLPQIAQADGASSTGTATPTATPTRTTAPTVTATGTTIPQNTVANPGFEQGPGVGWTESSTGDYPLILDNGFPDSVAPRGGQWVAWLGGVDDEVASVQQTATVPANAARLGYWAWILSDDACDNDSAKVVVNGEQVMEEYTLCQATNTDGWSEHSVDLAAFAGQEIVLQVQVATNSTNISSLFLDDFVFTAGAARSQQLP